MTREEAVRSFTVWNARSIGREGEEGSLEVGKRADLVALSDDVFTCAEETIAGITPALVMVGGEMVGEAWRRIGVFHAPLIPLLQEIGGARGGRSVPRKAPGPRPALTENGSYVSYALQNPRRMP